MKTIIKRIIKLRTLIYYLFKFVMPDQVLRETLAKHFVIAPNFF